jgi:hypothetical protein
MERAVEKMKIVVPVTLLLIFLLLYLNFRRLPETFIVMLSVPFALVGGVWLMWWLDYNLSVAVAVGFIALAGVAAETGVVMLIYLDHAWEEALKERCRLEGRLPGPTDLYERGDGRCRRTGAPQDDDGGGHHGRPVADHVGHRHRLGGDEPHCRTDGRRNDLLHRAHAGRDSGAVCAGQAVAAAARPSQPDSTAPSNVPPDHPHATYHHLLRTHHESTPLLLSAARSRSSSCPAGNGSLTHSDQVQVFKSPTCGCCGAWVEHMRAAGFTVKVTEVDDTTAERKRLGLPDRYGSCHTATVAGYVLEGHVPAAEVKRLLAAAQGPRTGGAGHAAFSTRHGHSRAQGSV